MRKILSGVVLLGMVLLPLTANAQESTASLQAQAQSLLQEVQQLEAQIAAQGGIISGTPGTPVTTGTNTATVTTNVCPNIGRSLSFGSTGSDVTALQQFLATDPTVYPEGEITGYFGSLTQAAVRRFQTKYNIVSSGNPQTTGYGVVGPRTASVIAVVCAQQSTSSTTTANPGPTQTPTVGGYVQISPVSGPAPLTATVTATINTVGNCNGATYMLNFGDGSAQQQMIITPGNCSQETQTFAHTYTSGGTYAITLSSGTHQTSATVTVSGTGVSTSVSQDSFGASITSGQAPLQVTFIGDVSSNDIGNCVSNCDDTITFGDGTQGLIPLPTITGSQQSFSISHTYNAPGSYTVDLLNTSNSLAMPQGITVTVSGQPVQTPVATTTPSNTPLTGYGIVSITPGVGGNPLAVSGQLAVPCSVYSVDWGDGTLNPNAGTPGACTTGSASEPTVSHTYTQGGTYTIKLEDGSGAVQASGAISISN